MMNENPGSFRVPEKIYFKKGCLPVALEELKYIWNCQKVLIVTSPELQKQDAVRPITKKLGELGIVYAVQNADAGMRNATNVFEPDCILVFGSDEEILLAQTVMLSNIQQSKLQMGKKVYFITVPCLVGMQSQVLDYGNNNNFADMVIVDTDLMSTNINDICWVFYATLNVALCACDSDNATDYSDSMAIQAINLIFEYLPKILENSVNNYVFHHALEKLASAGTMAGIAFSNAHASFNKSENHTRCAELLGMDSEILTQKLKAIYKLCLSFI